jgi:hypothetical protein
MSRVKALPEIWRRWTSDFRQFMGWLFALDCVGELFISVRSIWDGANQQFEVPFLHRLLMLPIFSLEVAVVEGVAWWMIWRRKRWATGFGIAASLMFVLMFTRAFILALPHAWEHIGALIFGIIGLVAFISHGKYPSDKTPILSEWLDERNAPPSLFGKR